MRRILAKVGNLVIWGLAILTVIVLIPIVLLFILWEVYAQGEWWDGGAE